MVKIIWILYIIAYFKKKKHFYIICSICGPSDLRNDACLSVWLSSCRFFLLVRIASTVLVTFALCWLPFLSDPSRALQVVRRIFPVARGLFEVECTLPNDKVSLKTTSKKLDLATFSLIKNTFLLLSFWCLRIVAQHTQSQTFKGNSGRR